jgi:hypothetical protein
MAMNKQGAGFYNRPFTHLVRTTTKNTYGDTSYKWGSDGNTYFGSIAQTQSQEVDELGRIMTITRATIKLRGWYITISPLDKLTDLQFSDTYFVDSCVRGNDEWIVEAHHV